jgi:transposase
VFALGPATRIYLAAGATDMRKGFDGLYGLVRGRMDLDPQSGHLFLFANRARTRVKLLCFDGTGLWVCAKRLGKGRFRWPEPKAEETRVQLGAHELALLLGGMDLAQVRLRRWHRGLIGGE